MKDNRRPGQQLKGLSVPELLGVSNEESAMEIDIRLIHPFKNHPFLVVDDERMQDLVDSIRANGVLSPVLVRESGVGRYEMISGHRRMHAAGLAGLTTIPAIIRDLTDDEATIAMVDANLQREELLPSEKAYAFRMKMEAIRHQGASRHNVGKPGMESADVIGEASGIGGRQVQRYIRLTELIPDLLCMVDTRHIQFTIAVDISYIDKITQKWLYEYIRDNGSIRPEQITALRRRLERGPVNQCQMIMILNENLKGRLPSRKVTLPEKTLDRYFPQRYSAEEIESIIKVLLENWMKTHGGDEN